MSYGTASHSTQLVVGVADLRATDVPDAAIITYALGSCLGVTVYDSVRRVGGMLHALLPEHSPDARPDAPAAMFVDTGLRALLGLMSELGSRPEHREVKVFGGARVLAASDYLSIGLRNTAAMKKLALVERLYVKTWDVGGQSNRTIQLYLDDGTVAVRMPGRGDVCV